MANENQNTGANFGKQQYDEYKKLAESIGESVGSMDDLIKAMGPQGALRALRDLRKEVHGLKTDFGGTAERLKDAVKEFANIKSQINDSSSATRKLIKLTEELQYDQLGITELGEKDLKRIIQQAQKEQTRLKIANESKSLSEKQRKENESSLRYTDLMLEGAKERLALEKHITKQMGIGGAAIKGMATIADKLGVGAYLELDEVSKKMRDAAKDGSSKLSILALGISEISKGIGKSLTDPLIIGTGLLGIFKYLIKAALDFQSKVFEAGKSLGVNLSTANGLFNRFKGIAAANGQMALTAKELVDTYAQVNNTLGVMGPQNSEFLTTTAGIQRRIGATAEDMLSIQYYSAATGKYLQQGYASVIGSAKATAARLKMAMTDKQIMEAISKVSATVFNNFKGNVKQLGEAVIVATKFGTTLDQINSAGMSLLDFESSISKEFEAQLLTGKDLDLSRARQLALTGNTAALMKELTSTLGTYDQWNDMNVFKQQSWAEALGMSKEAVDDIFKKQQLIAVLGDQAGASALAQYNTLVQQGKSYEQIAKLIGDQAAQDGLRASVSEKLQATMERVKDTIGQMAQVLIPVLDKMATWLSNMDNIKTLFNTIKNVAIGLVSVAIALNVQKRISALLQHQELVNTIKNTQAKATEAAYTKTNIGFQIQANTVNRTGAAISRAKAVSEAAAGAGWLGPLAAIAAGVAVSAWLSSQIGNIGGGGGGGAAAMPTSPTGISPMNTTVANSQAKERPTSTFTAGNTGQSTVHNIVMKVGETEFAKTTVSSVSTNQSTVSTDNTLMNK